MQRADNRNTSNRSRVQELPVEWMPFSWKCMIVRRRHCQTDRMRCLWIDFSRYYSCCAKFTSLFASHSKLRCSVAKFPNHETTSFTDITSMSSGPGWRPDSIKCYLAGEFF